MKNSIERKSFKTLLKYKYQIAFILSLLGCWYLWFENFKLEQELTKAHNNEKIYKENISKLAYDYGKLQWAIEWTIKYTKEHEEQFWKEIAVFEELLKTLNIEGSPTEQAK